MQTNQVQALNRNRNTNSNLNNDNGNWGNFGPMRTNKRNDRNNVRKPYNNNDGPGYQSEIHRILRGSLVEYSNVHNFNFQAVVMRTRIIGSVAPTETTSMIIEAMGMAAANFAIIAAAFEIHKRTINLEMTIINISIIIRRRVICSVEPNSTISKVITVKMVDR